LIQFFEISSVNVYVLWSLRLVLGFQVIALSSLFLSDLVRVLLSVE
jgi:hypothetical protein